MSKDYVILVDEDDNSTGTMEKLEAHRKGLLHRAFSILVFNSRQELLIHKRADEKYHSGGLWTNTCCSHPRPDEPILDAAHRRLSEEMGFDCPMEYGFKFIYNTPLNNALTEHELDHVVFGKYDGEPVLNPEEVSDYRFVAIPELKKEMEAHPERFTEWFRIIVQEKLDNYLYRAVYVGSKNISQRFKHKNIYEYDLGRHTSLYQSKLFSAIKAQKREREGKAGEPAVIDFGPVQYVVANHFGFCLGVANAIDVAYSALAENPGKRIYMLSELIHNPFVNEDLKRKGLRFLQNDKGDPVIGESGRLLWDELTPEDVVVIPAFGATNDDKNKLIQRGVDITQYDATCRLVENVWLRARMLGKKGYTIVLHGKSEHEETKASFSYSSDYAPTVIVRNLEEARKLAECIQSDDLETKEKFYTWFNEDQQGNLRFTKGFDVHQHLEKVAVVNQTTLLAAETLLISDYLKQVVIDKFGEENINEHFGKTADTLCYATNANQEAAKNMLAYGEADLAIVVGGKNSSNTSQLYKLCEERLGKKAFYIQSEQNIISASEIIHYDYRKKDMPQLAMSKRSFLPNKKPLRILITGGASCPDGLIQQVVNRINSFFPENELRSMDEVIDDINGEVVS